MQDYLYNLITDKYKGIIPSLIKLFLFILSLIYGLVIRVLIFFQHLSQYQLNAKVISVGNITLGGTGKTVLVEYIAKHLKQQGHKVAILTRGYKRKFTDYKIMADEPYMLAKKLEGTPVIVDANRIRAGSQTINRYGVDTLILDDGFQQWKIKKDLEIATIDATYPFGNHYLIPRGILREPISSLRRADIFVLTKTNLNTDIDSLKEFLSKLNPEADIMESSHKPVCFYNLYKPKESQDLDIFKGKTVTLFSGIASPGSFENLIRGLDINIGLSFRFADHYPYKKEDLDKIIKSSKEKNIDTIITTEKDAVRVYDVLPLEKAVYSSEISVLKIALEIKDEQGFHNRLLKLYPL
jgi:tetraacyldisaccharide 4'-kinase